LTDISIAQIVIAFLVLLFSLTVHEASHAWAAYRCGDSTARALGRMTLNPVAHIDPIGTVVFPLIAIATHVPVIGWAKPVPVNEGRLRSPRRDMMLVAAAGPASNLALAVSAAVLIRVLVPLSGPGSEAGVGAPLAEALARLLEINVLLAIFNMLPIPPLDGSGVLEGLLPPGAAVVFAKVRPYGFVLLYALLLTGTLGAIIFRPYALVMSWLL
jgi:Zn-dependent protease